jgi:hypothetical protein
VKRGLWLLVAALGVALVGWVASHTYWADMTLPLPPKGEALTNPFYAAQRFTDALGSRSVWDRVFVTPPPDSVIVVSTWRWSLSVTRREALKRWVEAGGRLVVDATVAAGEEDFERWSGVVVDYDLDTVAEDEDRPEEPCRLFDEDRDPSSRRVSTSITRFWLCGFDRMSFLLAKGPGIWRLRDKSGTQVIRVARGRGHVTVINGSPFRYRGLFDGDHARLFVAATELRRQDDVHFLSEDDHPSLLALTWRYGAPVVVLTLALIALALWRTGVRFGPLLAPIVTARRSLAEQIRGTGQFALRHGGGAALHAAAVRALDEAAARRVPGYLNLAARERGNALATLTGLDPLALLKAIHHQEARRPAELRNTIALLEAARRLASVEHNRSVHGTT